MNFQDLESLEVDWNDGQRILLPEEVYFQVITRFRELDRFGEELINTFKQWIPKRKRTMEKLEELASKLHEQHINVSKSTIAGASASTVGGILAIAGLIATPFTWGRAFGPSLAPESDAQEAW